MKLTKKQTTESSSHDLLHIYQSFKCEYSSSNFVLLSTFNVAIYVAVFTTPFEWNNSNISSLFC